MTPPDTPEQSPVDSRVLDVGFVDAVMERVRRAHPADDSEELFPGRPSGDFAIHSAPPPTASNEARARPDRWTRLAVVMAVICLAVRVSLLGSMLAGEPIDELPNTASRSAEEVADDA